MTAEEIAELHPHTEVVCCRDFTYLTRDGKAWRVKRGIKTAASDRAVILHPGNWRLKVIREVKTRHEPN